MNLMITRMVRSSCNSEDIHLRCTFPACGCTMPEKRIRAAIGEIWHATPEMIDAGCISREKNSTIETIFRDIIDECLK